MKQTASSIALSILVTTPAHADPITYTDQTVTKTIEFGDTGAIGKNGNNNGSPNGLDGDPGSDYVLNFTQSSGGPGNQVTTAGDGVYLHSTGGGGGTPGTNGTEGGNAGSGNVGGDLTVTSSGTLFITTTGDAAHGIQATSTGGVGAHGNDSSGGDGQYLAGLGGIGGAGGTVTVTLGAGANVTTNGTGSNAIFAQSIGGQAGDDGVYYANGGARSQSDGRRGGNTGLVTVTLDEGATLQTYGDQSNGIAATSLSGNGGAGASVDGGAGSAGAGGQGGDGGTSGGVTITSNGSIITGGTLSAGIAAQAMSGGGGNGGNSGAFLSTQSGGPGKGGPVDAINITNSGSIKTSGSFSQGILAQSISGGGGVGGTASGSLIYDAGGSAADNNNAGTINVTHEGSSASIETSGDFSQGIVAQSVGGGGGQGGPAGGMIVVEGGAGGVGGSGGDVTLTLNTSIQTSGIQTSGVSSHGAVAQSVAGGGGLAGVANSDGAGYADAIGGHGGSGGTGGTATINMQSGQINANGTASIGLLAQSIGGGGGAGGGAYSTSAGPLLDVAVAVGGTGGTGGNGGVATATVQNASISTGKDGQNVNITRNGETSTVTLPAVDSHGVLVQSVGGGGGTGGAGSAASYAIAIPNGSEDPKAKITVSAAFSTGGAGGTGGDGSQATVTIKDGSTITTAGDGSHGVITQSIGGGGGNGGDSSAMAATIGYGIPIPFVSNQITPSTNAINISHSVGGKGGSGGNGATTTFTLGDSGSSASAIKTSGDGAIGALVQSVGGNGGNGGIGNAAVNSWSTSQNADITIGVGGQGAGGGDGGSATATIDANGTITTHGHGAEGLLTQSIGGGGGVGTGSTINVTGLDTWATAVANIPSGLEVDENGDKINVGMNLNRTINIAATNGSGGHANTVTVTHDGTIQTYGIDSAGIVAQSIGGGGGSAGSAGADSTTGVLPDMPGSSILVQDSQSGGVTVIVPVKINSTVNIGGAGFNTGSAGAVKLTSTGGKITTLGDYSTGVIAQSIGGGGGRGRVVTVGAETGGALDGASQLSVDTKFTLGGTFLAGDESVQSVGHGDAVQVTLSDASISTGQQSAAGPSSSTPNSGLHAYGVLAQSIGGGGGLAIDGSADPNGSATLGMRLDFDVNMTEISGGTGGDVTLHIGQGGNGVSITTYGDGAHGAVLQSIGGGGGIANFGSSAIAVPDGSARGIQLTLGASVSTGDGWGAQNPNFYGGAVQVIYDSDAALDIVTSGNGAFGIVAQSIGGGGGLVGVSQNVAFDYYVIGVEYDNSANVYNDFAGSGGDVSIALPADTTITTTGTGAHGIVAQSIGSGGGLVTSYQYGQVPQLSDTFDQTPTAAYGNSGIVTVSTNGQINVAGAGAYGVLAQSSSDSGGMFTTADGVYLGQTAYSYEGGGESRAVTVNVQGSIVASGENGIGVLAQSQGLSGDGTVTVNVGGDSPGTVTGGSGEQGVGILISGGNSSNKVNITKDSWVWAASGSAIYAAGKKGTQKVDVDNQGQIYGNTWLQGGSIAGNYQNPTGKPPGVDAGTLTNAGSLVATPGKTSYVDGHLIQTASGRIVPHLDYSNDISGQYIVTGSAKLDGTIEPTLASAMPGKYLPVFTVEGPTTGTLRAPDSPLFAYTVRQAGNRRDIAITGTHFNAPTLGLNKHKGGVARTLENVFASGNADLGPFFAGLDTTARSDLGSYHDAIGELSPRSTMTLLSRVAADASHIADASMSCPEFASNAGLENSILVEGECAYFTTRGNTASLDGDSDRGSSRLKSFALQGGGQREISAGLLLGGSLAYQADSFNSHSDGVSADGNSVQGAITLKKNLGPWQVSGALFGNYGEYDTKRRIAAPGFSATAEGEAPTYSVGLRGRVAYTAGSEQFYLRPSVNLDLVHAHSSSFNETGAGDLGLKIASSTYNTAILTPTIEIGGRTDLKGGGVLRTFALAGVSLRSNDEWHGHASFIGGERSPSFGMQAPLDRAALRLGAGVQLFANKQVDVQIRYDAELGSEAKSHNVAAKFAYHF